MRCQSADSLSLRERGILSALLQANKIIRSPLLVSKGGPERYSRSILKTSAHARDSVPQVPAINAEV